jgi:hypothetical protein
MATPKRPQKAAVSGRDKLHIVISENLKQRLNCWGY